MFIFFLITLLKLGNILIFNIYLKAKTVKKYKLKIFLKIKGIASMDKYDQEITIVNVSGIRKGSDNRSVRNDLSLHKRVELHCHTKMSDMDGVSYAKDIIKQAISWGHKAIAITDHGVVQAFTEAYHSSWYGSEALPSYEVISHFLLTCYHFLFVFLTHWL